MVGYKIIDRREKKEGTEMHLGKVNYWGMWKHELLSNMGARLKLP